MKNEFSELKKKIDFSNKKNAMRDNVITRQTAIQILKNGGVIAIFPAGGVAWARKKGLPVEAKVSSYGNKIFRGKIDFISSRINADTRSLLSRISINNENLELLSGSLLEITVKFNLRDALSVPDTSIMMEGEKSYIYKVSDENITNKIQVEIGSRDDGKVEIISGLNEGDQIVAEGLKKVRPQGKIKPIKN